MNRLIKPAIVLVGYNRPKSMERLINSVVSADYPYDDITLVISIDQSDKSDEIERLVSDVEWVHGTKRIIRYPERQGLKQHILKCGDLSKVYGAVIILEDDLYVSPEFYRYTVQALMSYSENDRVAGISLYSHNWNGYSNCRFIPDQNGFDCYFGQFSITWGQCWTKKQWEHFKEWLERQTDPFDATKTLPLEVSKWGKQSWGKYFFKYVVEENLFYTIPYLSMTTNFSDTGEHCNASNTAHQVPLAPLYKRNYLFLNEVDSVIYDAFFERVFPHSISISGVPGDQICVDMNLCRQETNGKRYLLTTRKMDFPVIASYGMCLRPIEQNALKSIPGNDIFLYDIDSKRMDLRMEKHSRARIAYEMYGIEWQQQLLFGASTFVAKVKRKLKRIIK